VELAEEHTLQNESLDSEDLRKQRVRSVGAAQSGQILEQRLSRTPYLIRKPPGSYLKEYSRRVQLRPVFSFYSRGVCKTDALFVLLVAAFHHLWTVQVARYALLLYHLLIDLRASALSLLRESSSF
jgi:hypothetical protein